MPISLPEIEAAAHECAFGRNRIPEPTENQCNAGNYKMGRFDYRGLKIVIEQPRGSYRTGIDQKTGKRWTSRMAAHYGYIGGTKGADGDGVDCFIGFYPQSEHVFVINQNVNGRFDEHKTMLAFPDQESAIRAYKQSFDRDWSGLESIVQLSINQLKWWLKNGDMRRPIKQADLPAEGFETMKRVYWNENNMPLDGRTLDRVLYEMRQSDEDNLLLDSVSLGEILEDAEGVVMLDALVTPFVKLERKMSILQGIMERSASQIKPVAMQISDPFKQNGVVNVAVVYELSDGQTISIYFHNPDVTPQKIAPTDEVISWKWMLNKKDITIVVAPERGRDLDVREVARRILKLAEKNSSAFARANAKRADRMQNIQNLKDEIVTLEGELKSAQNELEVLKIEIEGRAAGGGLIIPDEEQQALKRREDAARAILENMDADQLAKVGASPAFRSVVTIKLGANRAIEDILENHPDDVETAIASVVSGSGESEETSTDQGELVITLSGNELGDFSDTEDGKKALRSAAIGFYDSELMGSGVLNIALNRIVEFDKDGRNKIKSFSADPRKLHLVHSLRSIVENGKPTPSSPVAPHDKAAKKGVKLVHILKTAVRLNGEGVRVRFLVYEKEDGHLFYDHSVDNSEVMAVMGGSGGVMDSADAADLNLSVLPPSEPTLEHHCTIDSIKDDPELINSTTFDSVEEKMVFNLFIEGEEPEVIEDDGGSEGAPPFQIGDYVIAIKDIGFYGRDEMRINHIKTDYDSNKQMLKLEDKGSQYWNASDFKLSRRSGDVRDREQQPEEAKNTVADVNAVMPLLKQFIGKSQLSAVGMGIRGEEKQYFIDKMLEIANTIKTMPKTYGQDGMGDKAVAYLHYFKGSADWYITEKDMEDEQLQAFGLADLFGDGGELGYISIEELIGSGVELDFNWNPKTIGEIRGGGEGGDSDDSSQEAGQNDMRGMSFAIERDGSILTSGSVPELADKNEPTSSFDYYKNLAIQMKGNLYVGDRNKSPQTTDNNELIFGMTWGEIQSLQQGKSIDRSVISMLPGNPILVYSSKGVDGSINASRSFLQSVVDGTADMDAETFPDQIEKAAEELGDGDVLVIQAANAYADYITKKSKELLS